MAQNVYQQMVKTWEQDLQTKTDELRKLRAKAACPTGGSA